MAEFIEFDILRDVDGVVIAALTYKVRNNGDKLFSYCFFREFDVDGKRQRTTWLSSWHLSAVDRLIPRVKERLSQEEEKSRLENRRYNDAWTDQTGGLKSKTISGEIDSDE